MKNSFGISKQSLELILETISGFPEIERAVIFGSRAMGTYEKGSDIDLAIYGSNLKKETPLNLASRLNEKIPTPYYIDVVAPRFLDSPSLVQHIERIGKPFFTRKTTNFQEE
ncbi:MAG: nucleotidyltransferase domain-containing protein [Bacteroidales bacterium]|nr:nucleotidyltransferase domain-containing protein [Bacteroidales bacterium]